MKNFSYPAAILICVCLLPYPLFGQTVSQPSTQNTANNEYDKILVSSQVFEALGKIGDPRVVPLLLKGLKSREFFIRAAACGALGKLKAKEAMPALTILTQDDNPLVKVVAFRALLENGDLNLEKQLVGFLGNPNAEIRAYAAEQLGFLGEKYLPYLVESLPKEKDYVVRMRTIEQLGNYAFLPAAAAIRKCIEDPNPYVRQAACVALGKIKDREAIPQIAKRLKDDNILVRSAAKESLGLLGERAYIKEFWLEVPNREPGAMVGLAVLGELDILPILLKNVIVPGDNLGLVRRESARALCILRPYVADSVEKALHKSKNSALSLNNLGFDYKIGGNNLILLVTQALTDKKNYLYPDAPFILKELRDNASLPYLRRALYQDDPNAVANVAYVLGELQDREAVDDLIKTSNRYGF